MSDQPTYTESEVAKLLDLTDDGLQAWRVEHTEFKPKLADHWTRDEVVYVRSMMGLGVKLPWEKP